MRRVERAIVGSVLLLSVLLMAPVAGWGTMFEYSAVRSVLMPNAIQFADEYGNPISSIVMEGAERRRVYIETVDFAGNGVADDYSLESITLTVSLDVVISGDNVGNMTTADLFALSPDVQVSFDNEIDRILARDYGYLGIHTTTEDTLHVAGERAQVLRAYRRLQELHVTALQQLGDDSSNYKEQQGTVKYALRFGKKTGLGATTKPDDAFEKQAPILQVLVRPADQGGGNGDNGGGSCDALALGAAALLVPGLFLLRKKR